MNWLKIEAPTGEVFLVQSMNAGPIQVSSDPGAPQDTYALKVYASGTSV